MSRYQRLQYGSEWFLSLRLLLFRHTFMTTDSSSKTQDGNQFSQSNRTHLPASTLDSWWRRPESLLWSPSVTGLPGEEYQRWVAVVRATQSPCVGFSTGDGIRSFGT